jgi:predicted alpha/beta superfamily hydrolase
MHKPVLTVAAMLAAGGIAMQRPVFGEMTQVRFVVVTPDAGEDQPPEIYCSMSVDGWPEQGRALTRIAPNIYAAAGPFRSGTWVEYKFLRQPSWTAVEKGANNEDIPNRRLQIQGNVGEQIVLHCVARWADRPRLANTSLEYNEPGEGGPLARVSTLTGDIRTHHLFHSPELMNARTIMVYLPPGYDDAPDEHYPVLYMHDGNNLFDAKTSAAGVEWGVDETAQRLIGSGRMRKTIIVAIYNTDQRIREYSPFEDQKFGGGHGDAYLAFIVETLKPFIDKTYRTLPDREETGIAGSSLGGLISLYAVFKHPEVFGSAGVVSPALFWANRKVFTHVRTAITPRPLKIWLDIGTAEGEPAGPVTEFTKAVADCRRLVRTLEAKGYGPEEVHYEEIEGGRHHELDWADRVDRMLLFLLGTQPEEPTQPETS